MTTNYTFIKPMRAKAFLLLALLTLLSASAMRGQNGTEMTVTIGDYDVGTDPHILFNNFVDEPSFTQQIFTPDDIRTSGVITSIAFYYSQSDFYLPNVRIYMKLTDKNQFDNDSDVVTCGDCWFTPQDLVFDPPTWCL